MENNAARRLEHKCFPMPEPYPWLVYSHGNRYGDQVFCNLIKPCKIHHRRIPELRSNYGLASYRGWCVVSNFKYHLFLWNPITMEKVELPQLLEVDDRIEHCTLSSPPSRETTCTIMLFKRGLLWLSLVSRNHLI